ncbi:hypothetical protein [Paractinoplanes rishiriensis]|uniref:hypothetical protein n=1 Tax=Paractinoplanes rishiriensis TaxID=1050105 RepID=UPI001941B157|nr:hypothetical protein [Actinoplanes rishiriensis]
MTIRMGGGQGGVRGKNSKLIAARERQAMSDGEPMQPQDVAEAMNVFLWAEHQRNPKSPEPTILDHRFVLAYEAGRYWWPSAHYRAAFRHVLDVATDAELGFTPKRRRRRGLHAPANSADVNPLAEFADKADDAQGDVDDVKNRFQEQALRRHIITSPDDHPVVVDGQGSAAHGDRRLGIEDTVNPGSAETDLVDFASILDQRGISNSELTAVELACQRLDQEFARTSPDELISKIRMLMKLVTNHLRQPQTLSHHERLVRLAARVAGLRAWACFDINDHHAADRWYDAAVTVAQDSKAWGLGAWLLGAQSLIPWHRREMRRAAALIERGIYFASQGTDATTRAWLYALQARANAGKGDGEGFDSAHARAQREAEESNERDRRHGMDFTNGSLDLRYYAGTSRLLLRQPGQAYTDLTGSLNALPKTHTKARAVLSLFLADAAAQSGDTAQARDLTLRALASTIEQPILPIFQQSRRVHRLVQQQDPASAATLIDAVQNFGTALTAVASKATS